MRRNSSPYFTTARFPSTCPETGKQIHKGDPIAYYPQSRQAFHADSKNAENVRALEFSRAWNMADSDY
jgi:hypothetical protein